MPSTCAFNSDPITTPAANKVTLTGGGRPDRQPGRQEGVTGVTGRVRCRLVCAAPLPSQEPERRFIVRGAKAKAAQDPV